MGRARQTRTQPGGEVSDQFGFVSEVGHSSGRRNGAPAECSVRKMAVLTAIADFLAGRSLVAYYGVLGDRRSLAPYCGVLPVRSIAGYCLFMSGGASRHSAGVPWGAPELRPVSPVCGRWNPDVSGWSGRKMASPARAHSRTVPARGTRASADSVRRFRRRVVELVVGYFF